MKYETGGRGSTMVSSGKGDAGGVSYGSYQFTSKMGGSAARFVGQNDFPWKKDFQGLTPGTSAFTNKWKEVAKANPEQFKNAEHSYIQKSHYDPLTTSVQQHTGVDVNSRSTALRDVVWSTAVQHGGGSTVVQKAFDTMKKQGTFNPNDKNFDANAIKAIYAERGRTNGSGGLVHFGKNSAEVQRGVANRFVSEQKDALKMLSQQQSPPR